VQGRGVGLDLLVLLLLLVGYPLDGAQQQHRQQQQQLSRRLCLSQAMTCQHQSRRPPWGEFEKCSNKGRDSN
jgi:hypothetical protein